MQYINLRFTLLTYLLVFRVELGVSIGISSRSLGGKKKTRVRGLSCGVAGEMVLLAVLTDNWLVSDRKIDTGPRAYTTLP